MRYNFIATRPFLSIFNRMLIINTVPYDFYLTAQYTRRIKLSSNVLNGDKPKILRVFSVSWKAVQYRDLSLCRLFDERNIITTVRTYLPHGRARKRCRRVYRLLLLILIPFTRRTIPPDNNRRQQIRYPWSMCVLKSC